MRGFLLSVFVSFFCIESFLASAQTPNSTIEKKLNDDVIHSLQEKIHVHIDRPDHITGEILWFKIYCVEAMHHNPLELSRIAYVEILDVSNQPVLQTKVLLEEGLGSGSFYIPATLPTGNYLFRAYTSWMKNMGPEFFFSKQITLINTLKANEESARMMGDLGLRNYASTSFINTISNEPHQ